MVNLFRDSLILQKLLFPTPSEICLECLFVCECVREICGISTQFNRRR